MRLYSAQLRFLVFEKLVFSKLNRAKKGENWHHLGDLGYNFSELSTPPSHTYE